MSTMNGKQLYERYRRILIVDHRIDCDHWEDLTDAVRKAWEALAVEVCDVYTP